MLGNGSIVLGCVDVGLTVHHGEGIPYLAIISLAFAIADVAIHHWKQHKHVWLSQEEKMTEPIYDAVTINEVLKVWLATMLTLVTITLTVWITVG